MSVAWVTIQLLGQKYIFLSYPVVCHSITAYNLLVNFFKQFIYWLCWVFVATRALQLWRAGAALQMWCAGFCCYGARALGCTAFSSCSGKAQQLQFLGSRAQAQQLWCTSLVVLQRVVLWTRSGPGMEPVFPALADGIFTTEPPGKLFFQCLSLLLC